MWSIYLIGIVLAVVCAKLLRLTIFQGETMPFVMELPPYRVPTPRSVLIHMWQRGWMFLKKAGTVILGISIRLVGPGQFPQACRPGRWPVWMRPRPGRRRCRTPLMGRVGQLHRAGRSSRWDLTGRSGRP